MTRLPSTICLITDAASGIGAASASLFAEHGARAIALDIDAERLAALASGAAAIDPVTADVRDTDAPARATLGHHEKAHHHYADRSARAHQ